MPVVRGDVRRKLAITGCIAWVMLVSETPRAEGRAACVTEGVLNRDEVTLLLPGVEPFVVTFRDPTKVRVTFSDHSTPHVEATGPTVVVEGPGKVVHHLRTGLSLERDMLFINETVPFSELRYRTGVIQTSVSLVDGLEVRDIQMPCDILRAGGPTEAHVENRGPETNAIGMARARVKNLVVYELPGAGTVLHLRLDPASVTFDVLRRRGEWIKIAWDGEGGSLRGWTSSSDVRMVKSLSGVARTGIGCCGVHPLAEDATLRDARLKAGASIHAFPAGPRWAVVNTDLDKVQIEDIPGKEWLRILRNPTVEENACDPRRSWVRRSGLQFAEVTVPRTGAGAAEPGVAADGAAPRR